MEVAAGYGYRGPGLLHSETGGELPAGTELLSRATYTYDSAQNLLASQVEHGGISTESTMPLDGTGRNRPGEVNGKMLEYDANGNLTRKGDQRFYYDFRNRLVRVTDDGSEVARYSYDAFNRRTENLVAGTSHKTTWSGWQALETYRSGTLESRHLFGRGLDEITRVETDTTLDGQLDLTIFPLYDHTGNVVAWTDPEANVLARLDLSPFGEIPDARVDTTPPEAHQILYVDGALYLELGEALSGPTLEISGSGFELSELPGGGSSTAPGSPDKSQTTWALTASLPVTEGRMAGRRLKLTAATLPEPGTSVRLEIPAEAIKDSFLNPLAAPISFEFEWPALSGVLLDTGPPAVEAVVLGEDGHLAITLSEPPDLVAASQSIQLDGTTATWQQSNDPYTLRTTEALPVGPHDLAIAFWWHWRM